jgi:DNA-binding response OmpR family regulator
MATEEKKKVLLAEDEQAMAGVLMHKLNAVGIQTLHVASGDQVIPSLQKEHFDLVLLDLMMPEMDGFEVLKKMQELGINTPVLVLSNLGQTEDILKVKSYGAKEYIIKTSVTPADILNYVKVYIGQE